MTTKLITLLEELISILLANGFNDHAKDIERLKIEILKKKDEPFENRQGVLAEIMQRTNIRWLGDLNIQTMNYSDWTMFLSRIKKSAKASMFK